MKFQSSPHTLGSATKTATYDDHDRLLTYGTKSFSYTNNGEVATVTDSASSTISTLTYDVLGNLKTFVNSSKTINYKVDAFDHRVEKRNGTTLEHRYVWGINDNLVAVIDGSNNLIARFIYGTSPNSPDYMIKGTDKFKIIKDHIGSTVIVINSSTGVISQEISYDEFGNIVSDTSPGFTPFGFAGCLYDIDTKLCRFGARDYDPAIGRWLSKDPILFKGGDSNLYGYVLQDPINLVDINGKFPLPVLIIGGAGIANAFGSALGTYLAGGNSSAIISAGLSGFMSGALTGASALGSLYFGIPGGAAAILTSVAKNVATSLTDATDILGNDLPQGHMDFSKKACQ